MFHLFLYSQTDKKLASLLHLNGVQLSKHDRVHNIICSLSYNIKDTKQTIADPNGQRIPTNLI